ncbi:DUF2637 domain-containing protein [Methanospirillum sp. J.3.6.1-F.2.7.3]|uniref:DUF2637 domain-containing protein n=1 Tax=Methanospirillum purgamenti TaxID=2834276 RepID=A0A8E7B1U7_9EURY|nr:MULTISPECIES: DUF2637 domain-containing protein [Methanospirillum]MDX8549536.1 DUF2637 domain-containing protein [Methanospirillum hungatei]QVV88923.1 DUF2637 domain-containing protein [Methanospirillum sp. J.3.6.1-F.2.7.3]
MFPSPDLYQYSLLQIWDHHTPPGDPIPTTPSIKKIESLVPAATGVLTLVVALCSFVLSFSNLRSSAVEAGFDPILAWCWPICIDALLISGSLMVLRGNSPGIILGFWVGGPHYLHRNQYRV